MTLEELEKRVMQRFDLNDRALDKAYAAMDKRLDGMNEFRDALKDQANRMATRSELEALEEKVEDLRRNKANLDGRLAVLAVAASAGMTAVFHYLWK